MGFGVWGLGMEEGYFQVKTIALADKEASKAPLKVVAHVPGSVFNIIFYIVMNT